MGVGGAISLDDFPIKFFKSIPSPQTPRLSLEFVQSYSLPYCPWIGYQEKEPVLMVVQSADLKEPACTLECSQIHLLNQDRAYLVYMRYWEKKESASVLSILAQDEHAEIYVEYRKDDRQCLRIVDASFPRIPELSPVQQRLYNLSKDILLGRTDKYGGVLNST